MYRDKVCMCVCVCVCACAHMRVCLVSVETIAEMRCVLCCRSSVEELVPSVDDPG